MQQQLAVRRVVPLVVAISTVLALAGCSSIGSSPTPTASPNATTVAQRQPKPPRGPVCPLTGLPAHKHQSIKRAPLAVKVDNVSEALPQAGVNKADVVVEELVEGGLTRLMAIFQCSKAPTVGPIRSARISDADVLALLHGSILGFSGANPKDLPPIEAHGDTVLVSPDTPKAGFYRGAHAAPHNLYSSTHALLKAGLARRHNLKAPKPLFSYGATDPAARRARHISLTWPATSAVWTWSHHAWLRTQDGEPDKLADGSRVSATNVVVMSVDIASTGLHDVLGTPSPLDVTVGSNPVWVLRNGKMVKGTWHRKSVTSPLRLLDPAGHTIHLAPGRTWVELLPTPHKPSRH
jgi:hypothetical protein